MSKIDQYEKDLIDSYNNAEWKSRKNPKKEIERYKEYAINSLKKDKRINIRISARDLEDIRRKAVSEGLPYQSLIASIIHKYNAGKLVDKDV